MEGVIKAKKLRKQIELFQHYRQMGIRTLEQARQYEIERKKREHEQKVQKHEKALPTCSKQAGARVIKWRWKFVIK